MLDLSKFAEKVFMAPSVQQKKQALVEMITASHAKSATKNLFLTKVQSIPVAAKLDKLAVDYMLSGEGMKVI